ncbi:hypothetical protein VTN96DRAFT_6812 [Rasamsonia emersonii]
MERLHSSQRICLARGIADWVNATPHKCWSYWTLEKVRESLPFFEHDMHTDTPGSYPRFRIGSRPEHTPRTRSSQCMLYQRMLVGVAPLDRSEYIAQSPGEHEYVGPTPKHVWRSETVSASRSGSRACHAVLLQHGIWYLTCIWHISSELFSFPPSYFCGTCWCVGISFNVLEC